MSVVVVTPSEPLLTPAQARDQAPVLRADDDPSLLALIAVAQATLDPPSWLGSALGEQVLEFRAGDWPWRHTQSLPYGPVSEVQSIKYDDLGGVEQTLSSDTYRLIDPESLTARIALKAGKAWPRALCAPNAIRVRYKAGRPLNDPRLAPAKHAIVLSVIQLRSLSRTDLALRSEEVPGVLSRTWVVSDAAEQLIRRTVESLLAGYKVWSI